MLNDWSLKTQFQFQKGTKTLKCPNWNSRTEQPCKILYTSPSMTPIHPCHYINPLHNHPSHLGTDTSPSLTPIHPCHYINLLHNHFTPRHWHLPFIDSNPPNHYINPQSFRTRLKKTGICLLKASCKLNSFHWSSLQPPDKCRMRWIFKFQIVNIREITFDKVRPGIIFTYIYFCNC